MTPIHRSSGFFLLILLLSGLLPVLAQDISTLSPPDDLATRPTPTVGSEALLLASEVGAVGQITGQGAIADVFPLCRQQDSGGAFRAVCQSGVFPPAGFLQYSIFELADGQQVSLVMGYFGEIDTTQFPELATQPPPPTLIPSPTPPIEPTAEGGFEVELREVATPIQQAEQIPLALQSLERARDLALVNGQLGAEQTGTGANPAFFFASIDGDTSMVWQRGDWLFMASAPSAAALNTFVQVLPY